ncbi:hypothetical protein DFH06DRAFT_1325156 [Mycena polygramma]|nr:hypothetical protein DFH06DRAFT_1325156 [Mycena polygramma]
MSTNLEDLHWQQKEDLLAPSSEFGSDGELYQAEASQHHEIIRVARRREERQAKRQRSESPSQSPPRASALPGKSKTSSLFDPGGPLDSQVSSQAYIAQMHHDAGMSIHTQTKSLSCHPLLGPNSFSVFELLSDSDSEPDAADSDLEVIAALQRTSRSSSAAR